MIVLTCTLAGLLAVCIARFGRQGLIRFTTAHFHSSWMLLLACVAQAGNMIIQQQRLVFLFITASMLIWFCWQNRHRAGMLLIAIGIGLNMLVMAMNGGTMPVSPVTAEALWGVTIDSGTAFQWSKSRVLEPHETQLAWFSDHILLPGPLMHIAAWSIGDFFLIAGVSWGIWSIMKGSTARDNDDIYSSTDKTSSLLS